MTQPHPHLYTVALRFTGADLEPQALTEALGWEPSHSGQRSGMAFWSFDGRGQPGFQDEWTSLEQGLDFVLSLVQPRRSTVLKLSTRWQGCWWCGHFQSSFSGGPTLSPRLLKALAEYPLALFIDGYFSDPEVDE